MCIPRSQNIDNDINNCTTRIINPSPSTTETLNNLTSESSTYDLTFLESTSTTLELSPSSNSPESDNCNSNIFTDLSQENEDPISILNNIKLKNSDRLIIGHLNVNSLRSKFEALSTIVKDKVDILILTETKLDITFPTNQFMIDGFSIPFRFDRKNSEGGGIFIYVRDDIPCDKLNKHHLPDDIEGLFIQITLRKRKWVLFGGYNPRKEQISYFLNHVGYALDKYLGEYDNLLLLGDFNSEEKEGKMKEFLETYNLQNLIKEPTCFKNVNNPSSIDLILTNRCGSFHESKTIETGISDFHKMTVTVLKTFFKKKKPNVIKYRDYKHFNDVLFRDELKNELDKFDKEKMDYNTFSKIFMNTLNRHAPIKEKLVRGNNAPFMNKTLSKSFMLRSKLRNNYIKNPSTENESLYKKQRNYCVKLLKAEKKKYYNNLDLNVFTDNKTFWKCVKPLFSDKQKYSNKEIMLMEGNTLISNDKEVAETMNTYFIESVENLDIIPYICEITHDTKTVSEIIKKFENHPSVLKIKEYVNTEEKFSFTEVTSDEFQCEINQLDIKKATVENDIPAKVLIGTKDIIAGHLSSIYNNSRDDKNFPNSLKLADVTPIHKKEERTKKENYRPVSLLPVISKLFERNMYNQINTYIDKYLSPFLFGFRKGYSTEQCLIVMLELWRKALDKKQYAAAVLTDLSKAFDCLNHELLIAKLEAYAFDENSLTYIHSYLTERKQRTKINTSYSSWKEIKSGVPQGSILGPLLFNIFLNDIFLFVTDTKIANYADDNTAYASGNNIEELLNIVENDISKLFRWFQLNEMKSNEDKCHLLVSNREDVSIQIGNEIIEGNSSVKLLGVTIDNNLNFNEHVTKICNKASQKLHALARVSKFIETDKLKIIMKTFFESQFNYCPLIWMFHSRTLNNRINRLHERALRLVYKNPNYSFQDLLDKDNSVTIHHRNLQKLATEMFKIKNHISSPIIQDIFPDYEPTYDFRKSKFWEGSNIRTVIYGSETLSNRGPKTWEILPQSIKNSQSLNEFKEKVKHWKPVGCTCRLCKTFIQDLGFL